GTSKFELTLRVLPARLQFEWCADLFERVTIERWADAYTALLDTALAAPTQPLARLELLDAPGRAALLALGTGPTMPIPASPLHELVFASAMRCPTATAVRGADGDSTFGELAAGARGLAHALRARGAGPGSIVAVSLPRGRELLPALLGVL